MNALFADLQVNQGNHQDNAKENQCGGAGTALIIGAERVIDKAHHGIEAAGVIGRAHGFAENTNDAGIFLESADEAGNDHIGQHGRKQRHRDAGENPLPGGAVHLGGVIILLIDALQSAQQYQDLEGQGIPYDINDHDRHIGRIGGAVIDPVDMGSPKEFNYVIDDACRFDDFISVP